MRYSIKLQAPVVKPDRGKGKQKWTEEVCEKASKAVTHSEMWQHFKKLTCPHDEDGVGPLLDKHNPQGA